MSIASIASGLVKEVNASDLELLGEIKDYDRIIITHNCGFLRFNHIKPGEQFNLSWFHGTVIYVSGKVDDFEQKHKLLKLATETMPGHLDSIAIVRCIEQLFDKNCYDGHIRVYKKGYNKKDFNYYKNLTSVDPQTELYNIGFCFRQPRKTKEIDMKYLSPLIKGNCYELWYSLSKNFPKLKGLYSMYNILTSEDLNNIDQTCCSFMSGTPITQITQITNTEEAQIKKLIKKFGLPIRGRKPFWVELE